MRRLVLYLAMATLVMARPEMYREKEDFQYSRSSSNDGTKSGYYDAQRGNMGGNYERAHNMDTLAQHQMGGLVKHVEGELGDASKTRTGSVFTSSNSRGVYGSGHYDLSNLQGRNFQEGVSYGDAQAVSSSNSAFSNARYRSNGQLSNSNYIRHQSNLDAQNSYDTNQFVQESQLGRTSKHYTQSAYEGSNSYVQGNTEEAANNFGSNTHNRLISTVPVKVIVRPGQRIAVPIATQTHSGAQSATYYDQSIANQQALDTISRSNSHYTSSDQNAINSDAEVLNIGSHQGTFKPNSNGKHYESSYSYHKEWEKHDTNPSLVLPTLSPIPVNSELYDDSLTKHESQHNDNRYGQNLSQNTASSQSMYQSALSRQHQSASSSNSNYLAHNQGIKSNLQFDAANLAGNSKPQSYHSSYSYHKSWERQGDPYIIKPASNSINDGQTAERLTDAASSYNYDSSITNNQQDFSYKCLVACEPRHTRVARSYGSTAVQMEQQNENISDLGQQTQTEWNIENFAQQTQNQEHLGQQMEDFGQQTQQLESFGQQSQNAEDFGQQTQQLESFGHQSQNSEDFGQQTQQLESFGQQSQNLEDFGQQTQQLNSFGQQSQNLEDFGQQTQQLQSFGQQSQNLEDLGQQTQQLESFGQQTQQLESFGQQSQNLEDLGQQTQQLDSFGQQSQNSEDFGQQTQHLDSFGQQSQNVIDFGQQTQQLESFGQQSQNSEDFGQQTQDLHYFDQQLQKNSDEKKQNTRKRQDDINRTTHDQEDSVLIAQSQDSSNSFQKDSSDKFQSNGGKNTENNSYLYIATGKAYLNQQNTMFSDTSFFKPESKLKEKPDSNHREIGSLSNLWGKIDNLDGFYEKNYSGESQRSYDKLHEQFSDTNFHNSFANRSYEGRADIITDGTQTEKHPTEKTIEETKLTILDILSQKSLNENTNQHTIDTTTSKTERNHMNIGRGDIGPEDHPETINQSAEELLVENTATNNTKHILSENTTEQYVFKDVNDFKILKNMNESNITSTFINNKNFVDKHQEFADQQINIEQESWTFEQQNMDQRFSNQNQQSQNIYDFGQENVNKNFMDFSQQNEDFLYSNLKDKSNPQLNPVIVQETEKYVNRHNKNKVEQHKNDVIVSETDRKTDMYDETHKVIGIEGINRLNYNVTQDNITASTISPTTETSSFWKSVGNKFKNAKDKIASWF